MSLRVATADARSWSLARRLDALLTLLNYKTQPADQQLTVTSTDLLGSPAEDPLFWGSGAVGGTHCNSVRTDTGTGGRTDSRPTPVCTPLSMEPGRLILPLGRAPGAGTGAQQSPAAAPWRGGARQELSSALLMNGPVQVQEKRCRGQTRLQTQAAMRTLRGPSQEGRSCCGKLGAGHLRAAPANPRHPVPGT